MVEHEHVEQRILDLLPADGAPVTNLYLRETLGVDSEIYYKARESLREQGSVIRMKGRGGRTALVVSAEDDAVEPLAKWWSRTQKIAYVGAAVVGIAFLALLVSLCLTASLDVGTGSLVVSLLFGAISLFAAGVAVNIYRIQADQRVEDNYDQARTNKRLEQLLAQTARNSSETREFFVQNMKTAEVAAAVPGSTDDEADVSENDQDEESSLSPADQDSIISGHDGEFYRPSAVPLKVLADLVVWWRRPGGATGKWTVENLVGGYRPYNKDGGLRGVPWILLFRSPYGESKAYRISYSGRAKAADGTSAPAVSRYSEEDNRWDNFNEITVGASREN